MSLHLDRREFLKTGLTAGLGLMAASARLSANEPFVRQGESRFRVSLVAFSFRKHFNAADPAKRLTLIEFLNYCAKEGFDAAELTGYYFPKPVNAESLLGVKRHAFLQGVAISGTAMRSDFTSADPARIAEQIAAVKTWIDHSAILGAPYLRVLAGPGEALEQGSVERTCIAAFEECSEYAAGRGVFLGLENDSGLTLRALLSMVKSVRNPWFGLNLDLANFKTQDIYADLTQCIPYAVNIHVRRHVKLQDGRIQAMDLPRVLTLLRKDGYRGYLALKHEESDDPYAVIPGWKREVDAVIRQT